MTTAELLEKIEKQEYILPKTILESTTEKELIKDIEEIFRNYQKKLDTEEEFRRKYTELVNHVYYLNINREKPRKKKFIFDKSLIKYLLSSPESAR